MIPKDVVDLSVRTQRERLPVVEAFARVLSERINEPIPLGYDSAPKEAWWRRIEELARADALGGFDVIPWPDRSTLLVRVDDGQCFAVEFSLASHRIEMRDPTHVERLRFATWVELSSYPHLCLKDARAAEDDDDDDDDEAPA